MRSREAAEKSSREAARPEARDPWRRKPEPREQEETNTWRRGTDSQPPSREMSRDPPPPRGMILKLILYWFSYYLVSIPS